MERCSISNCRAATTTTWRCAWLSIFLGIYRKYRRFPRQVMLYAGFDPLRMANRLTAPDFSFQYRIVDAHTLDGESLLASAEISDNVMAVLTKLRNQKAAVRTIIEKIGRSDPEDRRFYLQALLLLAGLRGLENIIEEEAKGMPLLIDILDNKVLGREFKRACRKVEKKAVTKANSRCATPTRSTLRCHSGLGQPSYGETVEP